jgi:hypothetical protein
MSDHYIGDVQGAAPEGHGHTPREIGAAEEHDLDVLRRDVSRLESQVSEAQRQNAELLRLYQGLAGENAGLADLVRNLGRNVATLSTTVIGALS